MLTLPSYGQYGFLGDNELTKSWPPISPWSTDQSITSTVVDDLASLNGIADFDQDVMIMRSSSSEEGKSMMQPHEFYEKKNKKVDHNVKERLRRMKLNDSYSALLLLLPDSNRTKKKWSAPLLVDKVLEYIPELQKQVEKLTQRRDDMLLINEKNNIETQKGTSVPQGLTVSVTEANKGEVIVQICIQKDQRVDVLSNLLENLEEEGVSVATTSVLLVSGYRLCIHLHLHIRRSFQTIHYIAILKEKIVSWLCEKNASNFSISTDTQTTVTE